MERNTRSSLADAVDLAAIMPWQLGGALALLAYWILRELSPSLPTGNGDGITPGGFLQYGIPGLLLMLALLSFYRTLQADGSSMAGASSTTPEPLERITTQGIETLVAEAFRREGYLVIERKGAQRQGCVDLDLIMGCDRYLVQCSRWQEEAVDVRAVRELYAAISVERAAGGFIVTSGKFTDEARKMALGRSIRVVPADSLPRQLKKMSASNSWGFTSSPTHSRRHNDAVPPACPKCGKVMMPRTKKQDGVFVQIDWGCTSFPACQGSREI